MTQTEGNVLYLVGVSPGFFCCLLCALQSELPIVLFFSPGIGVIDPRMIFVMSVRASVDIYLSTNISASN